MAGQRRGRHEQRICAISRAVFATETQAKRELRALQTAKQLVGEGKTIPYALNETQLTYGPTSSRSTLHRWIHKATPIIAKCLSGFFLKVTDPTNLSFTTDEEDVLVNRILTFCNNGGYLEVSFASRISQQYRDENVSAGCRINRKRLSRCKFGRYWITKFVESHNSGLVRHLTRPLDHIRFFAFNAQCVAHFFAQVKLVFEDKNIVSAKQVGNLGETCLTSRRDLCGTINHRVVTSSGTRAVVPRANFRYSHRVSVLVAVFADGIFVLPAVAFRGDREPCLANGTLSVKASEAVPSPWRVYWRKNNASIDTVIFRRYLKSFISFARNMVSDGTWIVLFYDALRAHIWSDTIQCFHESKIAVIALPAHSSDRLQPLDVSIFGPFKHYSNASIDAVTKRAREIPPRSATLGGLEVWNSIKEGYNEAVTAANVISNCSIFPTASC